MLRLYNTLTRTIENFQPLHLNASVSMYSCGPTVYDYQHIGHMRRYVGDDMLVRVLKYNGYKVDHVMNITDVGHLVSDSDTGEDKMEKGARKYGKSVWNIAKKFEKQFWISIDELNIKRPDYVMHATDYIADQIALIKILEEKGYTYRIDDGVYFDTTKFKNYYQLSRQNPQALKAGARVDIVAGKKHPEDFALWKFSPKNEKRQMEWESPWGIGFPGWHIECSAMSMKTLGATLDIHTGGIDHINVHHTNEIAQSEAATGKQFVRYWVHHNFLVVEGEKMSKSLGNFFTVQDVVKKGFNPMHLRYLYLQTHYRQEMNFTWESLEAAGNAYDRLVKEIATFTSSSGGAKQFEQQFTDNINDDLNIPKALATVWELIRSDEALPARAASLSKMDTVLGLNLFATAVKQEALEIPQSILNLVKEREGLRKIGDFAASDEMREKIRSLGWEVSDTKTGPEVSPLRS